MKVTPCLPSIISSPLSLCCTAPSLRTLPPRSLDWQVREAQGLTLCSALSWFLRARSWYWRTLCCQGSPRAGMRGPAFCVAVFREKRPTLFLIILTVVTTVSEKLCAGSWNKCFTLTALRSHHNTTGAFVLLRFIDERAEDARQGVPCPGRDWGVAEPVLTCRPTRAQTLDCSSVENRRPTPGSSHEGASGLESLKLFPLCFRSSGP